jgi:trans-2,3-dihydro-3-hydroxyanthranilate isomerase
VSKGYEYVTVDVFTDRAFAGNPVAVVTGARGLTAEQMQRIAAEFHYSESTVVLPPEDRVHTAGVRIFTPRDEIPFAGHPNVGTAFAIALLAERKGQRLGPRLVFEERAGLVPVDLITGGDVRIRPRAAPAALSSRSWPASRRSRTRCSSSTSARVWRWVGRVA